MKAFTVKNTWSNTPDHGWGNGYVAIPPTSSWHGVDRHSIPVQTHGGITWSDSAEKLRKRGVDVPDFINNDDWIVGFDTVRSSDIDMDKQDVRNETYKLLGALEQLDGIPYQNELITQVRCPHCQSLNGVSHLVSEEGYSAETRLWACYDCGKPFYFSI